MEQRGQATQEKAKVSPEKKAPQGSQDERIKKEHTSPSGKPDLKKQTDQPEGKKFRGGKEETGPETGQPAVTPETQTGGPLKVRLR